MLLRLINCSFIIIIIIKSESASYWDTMRHVHYAPYDLSSLAAVNFILLCCHSVICVSESAICMLSFAFLCFSRYTTCITSSPQCEKQACRKSWIHRNMSNSDGFCAWISWYGTAGCVVDRLPVWTYLDEFNSFLSVCVYNCTRLLWVCDCT